MIIIIQHIMLVKKTDKLRFHMCIMLIDFLFKSCSLLCQEIVLRLHLCFHLLSIRMHKFHKCSLILRQGSEPLFLISGDSRTNTIAQSTDDKNKQDINNVRTSNTDGLVTCTNS